jgi:hypothetical protein
MWFSEHSKRFLRLLSITTVAGALVGVPAASARSDAPLRLSILPLPAPSLGSAAGSLPLQPDSGVLDNTSLASVIPLYPNRSHGDTQVDLAKLGRVSGYALDYGHGASGDAGITEVWTSVDEYKTSGDAATGLASWRRFETNDFLGSAVGGVLSVTITKEKAAAVGQRRFAALVAYSAANVAPLFGLDEQFTVGRYEADVTVWAGSAAAAEKLAPKLAKKLDARVKRALAGSLHARPVKLPPKTGSPGGPDLAPLGLRTTDLSGPATYTGQGYEYEPIVPFSFYNVQMAPAGQFQEVDQAIFWYPTANEARFDGDYHRIDQFGPDLIPLNLSSVGDGAWGFLQYYKMPGGVAELFFSSGRIDEEVFLQGTTATPIQASQAEDLAPIVANYINAAGFGS